MSAYGKCSKKNGWKPWIAYELKSLERSYPRIQAVELLRKMSEKLRISPENSGE